MNGWLKLCGKPESWDGFLSASRANQEFGLLALRQKLNGWLRGQGLQHFAPALRALAAPR